MALTHQDLMSANRLKKDRPKAMGKNWYFVSYRQAQLPEQITWLVRVINLLVERDIHDEVDRAKFCEAAGVPGFGSLFN